MLLFLQSEHLLKWLMYSFFSFAENSCNVGSFYLGTFQKVKGNYYTSTKCSATFISCRTKPAMKHNAHQHVIKAKDQEVTAILCSYLLTKLIILSLKISLCLHVWHEAHRPFSLVVFNRGKGLKYFPRHLLEKPLAPIGLLLLCGRVCRGVGWGCMCGLHTAST